MEFLIGIFVVIGLAGVIIALFEDSNSDELYRYMDNEHPDDYIPRPIDFRAEKWLMIR